MNDNVLTADDEHIAGALHALRKGVKEVSRLAENYLKVSRRTLQEYRNNRKIPFVIFGGKVLYRETDIEKMLEENYRKAIR